MKLKKIEGLCKSNKIFHLYDQMEKDENILQWLGDDSAMYQINGISYLDKESIYTFFDITGKQQNGYFFQHTDISEEINLNDLDPLEVILNSSQISVIYNGKTLLPLESPNGILFIQSKYLTPLEDIQGTLGLYERRTPQGKPYIAVKAGFMIKAVIFPYDVISDSFVSDLETLTNKCRQALEERELQSHREEISSAQNDFFQTGTETED